MDEVEQQDKQKKRKGKQAKKEGDKPKEKKRRRRKNIDPELIIELYDENLVAFKFLGFFNEDMKNTIKKRKNTCYDSERKLWVVTIKDYKDILDEVKEYLAKEHAQFQDIPRFATELMKQDIPTVQYADCVSMKYDYSKDKTLSLSIEHLPEFLKENLYNFQKKGIEFGISKYGRFLLGDEMGVGKTIQAIGISGY